MTKAEIVNTLARIHSWDRYLEIATSSTGLYFSKIDRGQLRVT